MPTFQENKDFWMKLTGNHPAIQKQEDAVMAVNAVLAERDRDTRTIHNLHLALESCATAAFYFNELLRTGKIRHDWKLKMANAFQQTQGLVNMTRRYIGQVCVDQIEERSSMFYNTIGMMALLPNDAVDIFHEQMAHLVIDTTKMLIVQERNSQLNTVNTPCT